MKLNTAALSLLALPILPCSAWRSRAANREMIEVFTAALEDNVHPCCPRYFNEKPPEGRVRNLEISQDCIDDTEVIFEKSGALQDIIIDSVDEVIKCQTTGPTSIACSVFLTGDLVDEIVDACQDAGGQRFSVPDFTGTCTADRYDLESFVSLHNLVECAAPSCDAEEIIALAPIVFMQVMEDTLRLDPLLNDVECSVDGVGGLRGGAIAGIVIASVLGAALM